MIRCRQCRRGGLNSGLLKNTRLLRCARHSSLRRTQKYASFLMILRALHLNVFEQPVRKNFFNTLLVLLVLQTHQRRAIHLQPFPG